MAVMVMMSVLALGVGSVSLTSALEGKNESPIQGNSILLPDDRLVVGTVEEVTANEVKVNTGQLMPRYLPLKDAVQNRVRPLIRGDVVEIWVNDQDVVVDYHPLDTLGWHRIVRGSLAQPLSDNQEWAVIRNAQGKEEAHAIRPLTRSKVAALPVGSLALFLIDRANKIVDATFGNEEALQRAAKGWQGSPPQNVDLEVSGSLAATAEKTVTLRKADGSEHTFEVRSFVQGRLSAIPKGASVILLVDNENKVTDVAVPGYQAPAMSQGTFTTQRNIWLLTGEILAIQGDAYTVEDGNGHEYRILVDKETKLPDPVEPGAMVHTEVDANNHALSVKRFGLFEFDEEFERHFLKTREAWLKKDARVGAVELRKTARLLKAEADRGGDQTRTALRKYASEFENLADDVKNDVDRSVADVESAFARARVAVSQRFHEKTPR
jgi:hypothetical protein